MLAAIAIIGGADGPTAQYLASRLGPDYSGLYAVAAYSHGIGTDYSTVDYNASYITTSNEVKSKWAITLLSNGRQNHFCGGV